jgi:uncharacterized BrkB/YihY/UPF0761 family membrane protein
MRTFGRWARRFLGRWSAMSLARGLPRACRGVAAMAGAVAHDYSRKGVAMIAAALAFYLFLGLFPFMLVVIIVTGYVLRSSQGALEEIGRAHV